MNLNWQVTKTRKAMLLGAPILCGVALFFLVTLFWIESVSRDAVYSKTLIIIEANQENLEQSDLEASVFDDSEQKARDQTLSDGLNTLYIKLTSSKINALTQWSETLKSSIFLKFEKKDQQLFHEKLGRYFVGNKEYTMAVNVYSKIDQEQYILKRTGFYSALAYSNVGDNKKALQIYENQIKIEPNHQASVLNYSLLLIKTQQYKKSIPNLEHAIDITSGIRKAKALRLIGGVYEKMGQVDNAIEAYRRSIIFEPDNSKVWLMLGDALATDQQSVDIEVADTLRRAIALEPNNYKARYSLANFYFSKLDFENARIEYSDAAKRASSRADLRLMQALNLFSSGRAYSAKKVLEALKDAAPGDEQTAEFILSLVASDYIKAKSLLAKLKKNKQIDSNFVVYLQLLYFVENTADEPLVNGRVVTALDSVFYWPAKLLLARYLNKRKRYTDAIGVETEILKKISNSAEALLVYGRSLRRSDQHDLALSTLQKAYALQSTSRRISVEYINELRKTEDYEAALNVVNDVLKLHPNYNHALRLKVNLLRKTKRAPEAIALLTDLFKDDGDNFWEGYSLAELQYSEGQVETSLGILTEVLASHSANVDARILRATILYEQLDYTEAGAEVARVLRLEPENKAALSLKKLILKKIGIN